MKIWLFMLLPLLIIIIFSVKRMKDKSSLSSEIVFHTIFQSIISYLFVSLIFFQGFLGRLYIAIIIFLVMLIVSLFYFLKDTELSFMVDGIDKLEAIKNNIIIVLITVLPLYVFLTIFRYLPWYWQILLSLVITGLVVGISALISEKMEDVFENLKTWFIDSDHIKYIVIWVIIGIFIFTSFFFQVPVNRFKTILNLNNNDKFWTFDGVPIDAKNNFEQELVSKVILTEYSNGEINDFYFSDDNIYLSNKNIIQIYSISESEIIRSYSLDFDEEQENIENNVFGNYFISHNDALYHYNYSGLFKVSLEKIEKISILSKNNSKIFYDNLGVLHFAHLDSENIYSLYELSGSDVSLVDTIDLSLQGYEALEVISDTLFYKNEETYYLFENSDIFFENINGSKIFNRENQYMYYVYNNEFYFDDGTNKSKVHKITGNEISEGAYILERLIFQDGRSLDGGRLLIFDQEMSELAIFNNIYIDKFIKSRNNSVGYIPSYREINDEIMFLHVQTSEDTQLLQIFKLEEKEVNLGLPFYTHYGIHILFWIFLGVIVPITDDIKYLTYIDFKSVTSKKNID